MARRISAPDNALHAGDDVAALVHRRGKLTPGEVVLLRKVFREIVHLHQGRVWDRLVRRGLPDADVEELHQETFLALFVFIVETGFPDNLVAKLCSLAEGKLLNHLRAKGRMPESTALPSSGSEKPDSQPPDLDRAVDLRQVAVQLFFALSPESRELVDRVILNGLTIEAAAVALDLLEGTAKSRFSAAKKELLLVAERLLPPSQRGS